MVSPMGSRTQMGVVIAALPCLMPTAPIVLVVLMANIVSAGNISQRRLLDIDVKVSIRILAFHRVVQRTFHSKGVGLDRKLLGKGIPRPWKPPNVRLTCS